MKLINTISKKFYSYLRNMRVIVLCDIRSLFLFTYVTKFSLLAVVVLFLVKQNLYSASIYQYIDSVRIEAGIPGLGYIGVVNDSIVLEDACGVKCLDTREPVNINSSFHLGSNTKAITALIAMKLQSEGKLKLGDKFFDYFPQLKSPANREYDTITLEMLLTHRAGIAPFTAGSDMEKVGELPENPDSAKLKIAQYLFSLPPEVPQGLPFVYSNAGYMLASMMLEKASGMDYKKLVNKYIEIPFGIKCGFGWSTNDDSTATCGHMGKSWGKDKLVSFRDSAEYSLPPSHMAAGDIYMTIGDYAKFLKELIKGYEGKSHYLSAKEFEILFFDRKIYALGWLNANINGMEIVTHDGSAGTFYCHTLLIPDKGIAVAVMCNSAEKAVQPATMQIREEIIAYLMGN